MGYQTGTIGPIAYTQDNSGDQMNEDVPVTYTPEQFGAPPGAQVITGTVQQALHITRGTPSVSNYSATADAIQFMVHTAAANDSWFFGWHSGAITVTTTFSWFYITDHAVQGGEQFFMHEGPAVLPGD
jgi:hypothetical protein